MDDNEILISLVVIRSVNMDRAATFYTALGLPMCKHAHGQGPEHYSALVGDSVFEIYPAENALDSTAKTRLGFNVPSVKKCVEAARKLNAPVIKEPALTPRGLGAIVQDFDGHKVELNEKI
jgi:lactoylglutathione lyase